MTYTETELRQMLTEVRNAISKTLQAQEYSAGGNMSVRRAYLKDLMEREKWLLEQLKQYDLSPSEGISSTNYVVFRGAS